MGAACMFAAGIFSGCGLALSIGGSAMANVRSRVLREKNVSLHPEIHRKLKLLALQGDSEIKAVVDVMLRFVLESDDRVNECVRRLSP